jgi:UDP-N-acetylmuramate--alanine ligase
MEGFEQIKQVYFVGIGGIGMSALARFFHLKGLDVAGYDRTPSVITDALIQEGIHVIFSDEPNLVDHIYQNPDTTLVVYTPAVKSSHRQLHFFRNNNFRVLKRSQVLGIITTGSNAVCVAGTHGKTTISTLTTHLFTQSKKGCTAFLGGISKNYNTNFLWNGNSPFVVLEADEFDRSFLTLSPHSALVSSVDSDHLDIYENRENLLDAFKAFGQRVVEGGFLLVKKGLPVKWALSNDVKIFTYALQEESDFYATNIKISNKTYTFNLVTPDGILENLQMGIPGLLNVENAVGACALALLNGVTEAEIRQSLPAFTGISRRFEVHIDTPDLVYIDDYAHHPEEIRATLMSIRALYPNHYLVGIFQPHLFSRTRDFAKEFSNSLSELDELIMLDIYPAREQPMEGVTSEMILNAVKNTPSKLCSKMKLVDLLPFKTPQVVVTMGAGDIDRDEGT